MNERMTLLELNRLVQSAIAETFPDEYWVEAELTQVSVDASKGHCYMEVVQKDETSNTIVAKAKANCWQSYWKNISVRFADATGAPLRAGIKVLMRVRVDFHTSFGFSLTVKDIDPAYTIGEMALQREKVIQRLKDEGVFELQRELTLPLFCQRIAVVSSAKAAGYGDFCNQLDGNEYHFYFSHELFPAIMQGDGASQSIIAQLNAINGRQGEFDCVVIIRGGGAVADLSCFDSLELAENVANFPLPIITGIGHERDICVLDLISHRRVKTPTAAAAFLIENLLAVWSRVAEAQKIINDRAQTIIHQGKTELQLLGERIRSDTEKYIMRKQNALDTLRMRMEQAVEMFLKDAASKLTLLSERIDALDPKQVLKRGFTLTLADGHIVKKAASLRLGQEIETIFEDGNIKSKVN